MRIRLLHTQSCESWPQALEAVRDAIHMAGVELEPDVLEVSTQHQAEELCFLGSPTVQLDGLDVEPAARGRTDYNLA